VAAVPVLVMVLAVAGAFTQDAKAGPICDTCHRARATVHLTMESSGVRHERHLCDACARGDQPLPDEAPPGPGVLSVIFSFLFGTIFGWWILLILAFTIAAPFLGRYRAWLAKRRFMAAQGQKFSNPQNADARYQLAEIYLEAGRWKQAHMYARDAVAIAQSNPLFEGAIPYLYLRALGQALYGQRRYADAVDAFERALKAKSERGYVDALLGMSKARYRMGKAGEALEFAKHAVAEETSNLEAYFRWAQAAAKMGRAAEVAEARERFWRTALKLPRYARQRRMWWRLAFATFPLSRLLG
jgi:Tfp pilus assembly protein PilF